MEKVRGRFIVEMLGRPQEVLSKALVDLIKEMKKDGRVIENEKYSQPKKVGKIIYSAFVEFEIVCRDLADFIGAVIDYVPMTVEIVEPEKMTCSMIDMQEVLNDLTARLYELDKQVKMSQAGATILQRKLGELQGKETVK